LHVVAVNWTGWRHAGDLVAGKLASPGLLAFMPVDLLRLLISVCSALIE
jgi:hypothetical protein